MGVVSDFVSEGFYAVAHPIETTKTVYAYTVPAVDAFTKSLRMREGREEVGGGGTRAKDQKTATQDANDLSKQKKARSKGLMFSAAFDFYIRFVKSLSLLSMHRRVQFTTYNFM